MESIRIKNFRSLQDTQSIILKPITILVGKNGAGKSTFLRTFPLFKQSVEERTKAPILFNSRNGVDFGSYRDVKSNFAKNDDALEFEFVLKNIFFGMRGFRTYINKKYKQNSDFKISMKISSDADNTPILTYLKVDLFENSIEIFLNNKTNDISQIRLNEKQFKFEHKLACFARGLIVDRFIFKDSTSTYSLEEYAEKKIMKLIKEKVRGDTSDFRVLSMLHHIAILSNRNDFLSNLKNIDGTITWGRKIENESINSTFFKEIYQYVILYRLEDIFMRANLHLRETFHRVKYLGPIRATAERYYRIQDLSVDEVDSHGQNLPMFLGSLTQTMMKKFQLWTEENFNFRVKIKKIEGHYSIKILIEDGFEVNMSDSGFGYSQILPIITQLWYSSENQERLLSIREREIPTILVIEQPELHLHPEFQAKFADVIVKVINDIKNRKINIKLIIETHSQTIINRLGRNISRKIIASDCINIVVFDKEDEHKPTTVTTSNFDDDGLLNNWPIGFFKPTSL